MHEIFDKLIEFIWGVWRFRWTALISAWAIALVGWFLVAQIDARYPATARLFVDTNRILVPLLDGIAVQPNVQQRIAVMSKTLLSRTNLSKLIDEHSLDQTPEGTMNRTDAIDMLTREIVITDINNKQSIYSLNFSHKNPNVAKSVLESLIEIFINTSFSEERADNVNAQRFLDKQIADYEARLTSAETRLATFKRENAGSLPGEKGGYYERLENLISAKREAELELQETINERDTLSINLAQEERKIANSSLNVSPFDTRIAEVQTQLDELLVRFTDRHPQVSILKKSLNDLQLEKNRQAGANTPQTGALLQSSIVYQRLSTLLAETSAEVAKLRVRVSSLDSRLDELRGTIDSIPEVEAKFTQLDRDYETIREQHQSLLNKREAAILTSRIDADSNDEIIRLLDPPYVPSRPIDPDRLVLNLIVLVLSILVGVALAFFLSILHPVFYNQRTLEHLMAIPVLGSVSLTRSSSEKITSLVKNAQFTALCLILPVAFIIVVYIQLSRPELYGSFRLSS